MRKQATLIIIIMLFLAIQIFTYLHVFHDICIPVQDSYKSDIHISH